MDTKMCIREDAQVNSNDDDRLTQILLLQRTIRSYYVQRQFAQAQKEYLQTVSDIEGLVPVKPIENIPKVEEQTDKTIIVIPTRNELLKKRQEIAMELLWIEQAIQSRKEYLRLKSHYVSSVS